MQLIRRIKLLLFAGIISGMGQVMAQNEIEQAKQFRLHNQYESAVDVLQKYLEKYPADVNALWLMAQTQAWLGHTNMALDFYNKAIEIPPVSDYLNLDYARYLQDLGLRKKAIERIQAMDALGKTYTSGLYIEAREWYWQGRLKEARKLCEQIMDKDGNNKEAYELWKKIKSDQSLHVEMSYSNVKDNQPTSIKTSSIQLSKYISPLLYFTFKADRPNYQADSFISTINRFSISNAFHGFDKRLNLIVQVGISAFPKTGQQVLTAAGAIDFKLTKKINWETQIEKKPYVSTRSSFDTSIQSILWQSAIQYQSFISSKIGFQQNNISNIKINTWYAWLSLPLIKSKKVKSNIIYSYAQSDANSNQFVPVHSLEQIISDSNNSNIKGKYVPVFTPMKQEIHSLQLQSEWKINKFFQLSGQGKYGFNAQVNNPYFFLNTVNGNVIIDKDYHTENYHPWDASLSMTWNMHPKVRLQATYSYSETYFYNVSVFQAIIHLRL